MNPTKGVKKSDQSIDEVTQYFVFCTGDYDLFLLQHSLEQV
jgi:hypothetical protein